ncbi:hypothetical protein [Nonomuraea typhae]|uniref:Uncharacterized protein n=1 Tax=Nonomuraea typhae TaxID=2603600 RepID=A0ABW7Z287_9ACTN
MSSRSIRSILAVAALTTGVSWLAAGPASAAGHCASQAALLKPPTTVASICDNLTHTRLSGTYGERMTAPRDSDVAVSAETLARKAGLPGLSKATAVFSLADMGGAAAAAGTPSLPSGMPRRVSMQSLPVAPDLPGLPSSPAVPGVPAKLPPVSGRLSDLPDGSGVPGLKPPIALPEPGESATGTVGRALPKSPDKALKAVPLPEGNEVTDGVTQLLRGLRLS